MQDQNSSAAEQELLSAFADDELNASAARSLTNQFVGDNSAQDTLSRYYLIGSVLRDPVAGAAGHRVRETVGARLQAEPSLLAPVGTQQLDTGRFGLPWVGGLALAASVAACAVLLTLNTPPTGEASVEVAANSASTPEYVMAATAGSGEVTESAIESALPPGLVRFNADGVQVPVAGSAPNRLVNYQLNHSSSAAGLGVLPHARLVGHANGQ